jgi:hypothetical protein
MDKIHSRQGKALLTHKSMAAIALQWFSDTVVQQEKVADGDVSLYIMIQVI